MGNKHMIYVAVAEIEHVERVTHAIVEMSASVMPGISTGHVVLTRNGTNPIMSIYAESRDDSRVEAVLDRIAKKLEHLGIPHHGIVVASGTSACVAGTAQSEPKTKDGSNLVPPDPESLEASWRDVKPKG